MVGRVFTVDDHINATLDTRAKMYSHHHCLPNNKPGNIIDIFVIKAKNSTVFGLLQYSLCLIVFNALIHSVLNFIAGSPKIVCDLYTHVIYIFDNLNNSCSLQVLYYIFLYY